MLVVSGPANLDSQSLVNSKGSLAASGLLYGHIVQCVSNILSVYNASDTEEHKICTIVQIQRRWIRWAYGRHHLKNRFDDVFKLLRFPLSLHVFGLRI